MSRSTPRIRDHLLPPIVGLFGPLILRILGASWRLRREGLHPHIARRSGGRNRYIISFWHRNLLPLTYFYRDEEAIVLVSRHGDGELIARVLKGLGYDVARGSSTRGGARAALELLAHARDRSGDIGITPDGPKGPPERAREGCVFLASRSGLPLLPLAAVASRAWQLRSWDRFVIPKPFATIAVVAGDPIEVPPDLPREEFDAYLRRLETAIAEADTRARALLSEATRRRDGDSLRDLSKNDTRVDR